MIRKGFPALAVIALMLAATPAGATKTTPKAKTKPAPALDSSPTFDRPDARELLSEAKTLWHTEKDYSGALAKFNQAVEADPKDDDVRLQRGDFFEVLSHIVVPEDKEKFKARAQADFETIIDNDPDSLVAGMARDGLARLSGEALFEIKPVLCPKTAVEIHTHADSLYGARRYADAAAEYEKAAAGCPDAASWWVDLADSNYLLENYGKAKELFVKALTVDPWNREAHRFLADTELQLSDGDAAVHQLVLAVVSDPSYESGWLALRLYATSMGRKWNRVYGDRKKADDGADGASWAAYRHAKSSARGAQDGGASALAVERAAVKSALEAAHSKEAGASDPPGAFWKMMSRADQAGFLDEAIFIHLLDPSLAAEYPEFREKNAERLMSYLEKVVMQ